jgi:hypothetical protein
MHIKKAMGVVKPVLWVIFTAQLLCSADQVSYFLVGPLPESAVIPIFTSQDIQRARDLLTNGQGAWCLANASVGCGKDGINRNYCDPTFPEWSWHVVKFNAFPDLCAEGIMLSPGEVESLFHGCETTGTNGVPYTPFPICFQGLLRELGPAPLAISAISDGKNLQLYWSAPGTNYTFTLEYSEFPGGTNWFAVPGVSWPLETNHWVVPAKSSGALYRVMAAPRTSGGRVERLNETGN